MSQKQTNSLSLDEASKLYPLEYLKAQKRLIIGDMLSNCDELSAEEHEVILKSADKSWFHE